MNGININMSITAECEWSEPNDQNQTAAQEANQVNINYNKCAIENRTVWHALGLLHHECDERSASAIKRVHISSNKGYEN